MRRSRFVGAAFPLMLGACNVTQIPDPPSTVAINECDGNEDCPGGACVDGACVTGASDLSTVILEVTPPAGSVLPAFPYYTELRDTPNDDIVLPPPAKVSGYVTLFPGDCEPTFVGDIVGGQKVPLKGTIPVDVTFTPSASTLGLPPRRYRSEPIEPTNQDQRYGFELLVPPGEYDVYIEPSPTTADSPCQFPPWLLLKQRITTSGPYDVKLSKPSKLDVPVHWATASLDNFAVALLDSVSGRVLSAPATLANPGLDNDKRAFYRTTITYSKVLETNAMNELVVSDASYQLVRLSPPEGTVSASIWGATAGIGLSESNEGGLLLSSPLPAPVTVEAQTAEVGMTAPVAAAVTVTATRLDGLDPGLFGSFVRTFQVDDKDSEPDDGSPVVKAGTFRAVLPPGDYIVDSIPKVASAACTTDGCPALAARRDLWQVATTPDMQAGKVIQFQRAPTVRGTAVSAVGKAVSGAMVRVDTSPTFSPDLWNRTDLEGRPTSLATTGLVDDRGAFSLNADPGTFDLFVQPDPSTRFGWYVRPRLTIDPYDDDLSVGMLSVPLARRYAGSILVGSRMTDQPPVPNALIRAYVYVTPLGEYAAAPVANGSVVQVAETRSNGTGAFELLIPASLDSRPPSAD